jgi:hypothetical protein
MARTIVVKSITRSICGLWLAVAVMMLAPLAQAQISTTTPVGAANPYPDFFQIATPGRFSLTGFGGGFVSDKYGTTQEGLQAEQSLTRYVGIVGRITGYQLYMGEGFANPLSPNPGSSHGSSRYNFGRFQGGIDFAVTPTTHVYVLGGDDAGDSHNANIEGDISSWWLVHSRHPLNFLVSSVYSWQNNISASSIDLRMVLLTTESYLLMAGGGGVIYGGGFVSGVAGQGGPDLGLYYRPWQVGLDAQAGYGTPNGYGQLTVYKQFSWME